MSNMATKSDFAQKLLTDLRQRKERMAAAQNSSRQSSQTSRATRGNSGQASRGAQQIESTGSIAGKTSRRPSGGSSRSSVNNIKESSSQIVLYESSGQSSRQVRDLQMAIAFAFENSGNLTSIGGSSSNPLVNFFNRFGRKSPSSHRSAGQVPTVSHIHINDISKGVHKLNQILSACSNGLNLDRNSIEIGRELLKGAINLEESLRMLVNLQDASEYYTNGSQKKSRLKLLDEEEEEEEDDHEKRVDQWKLDRPRFSFDKTSGNSRIVQGATRQKQLALQYGHEPNLVPHKRTNSYVQDLSLSADNYSSSSKSSKEKGRISNVVAKLMGLEEIPQREGVIGGKNDLKGKEWKQGKNEPLVRESRNGSDLNTNRKLNSTTSSLATRESQPRKDFRMQTASMEAAPDPKLATILTNKQQNHTNHANGVKSFGEREGKMLDLNGELQRREQNVSANLVEKRNANNHLARNQHALLQEQVPKRADNSEDKKSFAEQKPQQIQKQKPVARNHEGRQVEQVNAPKSKRSTPMNVQKKLPRDKSIPVEGRSIKPNEKAPVKDPPNRRHQDASPVENSQKTAANQESLKIEGQSHNNSSKTESEPQLDIEKGSSNPQVTKEKPIEVSATQKRTVTRKVQRREIPEKMVTRRNATGNHLTRPVKRPVNMLKDLKQQMQNKNRGSKRMEEPSDSNVKEGKEVITASGMTTELVKPEEKFETKDDQTIISNSPVADEFQNQNIQNKLNLNNNSDSIISSRDDLNDLQTEEQSSALEDEEELKKRDQSIEIHEDSTKLDLPQHGYMQFPAVNRQEQLTEPEKNLKEMVIKSQLFLSTAEALFKLNIPVSFLHAGDHHENEVTGTKLELDSAYEVLKRKARRHEVTYHPYTKTPISNVKLKSLDDLVRELCKDLEILKSYGVNGSDECDVAAGLHKMLNKDIYNEDPDVNCMWDFEWSRMMSIFPEMEDVVKDVERHMLNGLLDEITKDLLIIPVTV